MKDMTKILKAAREKKGLTLRGAARMSGVSLATLSKLESGELTNPTLVTIVLMQKAYGLKLKDWVDSVPSNQPTEQRK